MAPFRLNAVLVLAAAFAGLRQGQAQAVESQTDTFNSTFKLSKDQIALLNLPDDAVSLINVAAEFERSNWATGSVFTDSFYTKLPANASRAPAGSLLKVEEFVSTQNYTIAPTLALSRIVYQSKTLNETLVPVSAYILWPYYPRHGASVPPLVSWGHGISGFFPECAPSHIRNLWYQYSAPYMLALNGYAVVATDYAGLGVPFFSDGSPITHEYFAAPAAGNDMLYAAQAAMQAFPHKLSKNFVAMGHSQGGGGAWAAAQQQLKAKVPGYLGSISASPVTDALTLGVIDGLSFEVFIGVAKGIQAVFPKLPLSAILAPLGIKALQLLEDVQGCQSVESAVLESLVAANASQSLIRNDFIKSTFGQSWTKLTTPGGGDFEGPLLVLQSNADTLVPISLTTKAVNQTCQRFPGKKLHYVTVQDVDHVPTMYATLQIWLKWLDDRFAGNSSIQSTSMKGGCSTQHIGSTAPRPLDQYQGDLNYFLEFAASPYEVA